MPSWPGRGTVAQAIMTSVKAVSRVTRKRPRRIVRRRLRETTSSSASRTMRGSGECQWSGSPCQGKIPIE